MAKAVKNKNTSKKTSKKTNKEKTKKLNKQEWTLIATFIFLIVLVLALIIVVLNIKNITSSKTNGITIPVLEENSKNEISVDISNMNANEEKEYIFTITNYKDYDINKTQMDYDINITSPESVKIKLYKNNNEKDLLTNKATIENNKMQGKNKVEDEYKLVIESKKTTEKDAKITIEISS